MAFFERTCKSGRHQQTPAAVVFSVPEDVAGRGDVAFLETEVAPKLVGQSGNVEPGQSPRSAEPAGE
jgi:hypothetical protein